MKLQRAEEHFGQLSHEHAAFLGRNPYRMLPEDDPDREGHAFLWRAKIIEHPPLEKWSSLIGECAHALRAALDHTAYALVNRAAIVSEKRPAFPILDDRARWASYHPDKLPGIPPDALALIEQMQPYNGTTVGVVLGNVNQLDITDKHRRLNLVNATVEGTDWHAEGAQIEVDQAGTGPFEDGSVVGRWRLMPDVADQRMRMVTNFQFGIAMGDGEPSAGMPVLPMLERYRSVVAAVVTCFEDHLS
jgi:hypothetical protein